MIYFLREDYMGMIKIGTSVDVKRRMLSMKCNLPQNIECLGVMKGNYIKELEMHNKFQHLHHQGEWFRSGEDILEFIRLYTNLENFVDDDCHHTFRRGAPTEEELNHKRKIVFSNIPAVY